MAALHIKEVDPANDLTSFVNFPYQLYQKNPYWIPPIKRMESAQFDPEKNPALEHCLQKLWVAEKEGRVVGRIGCFINDLETQKRGEKQARFNWLEFEDDPSVSESLLKAASEWAKNQGAPLIKGPLGYSNFEAAGMTIEGFDELGTMGAPFHLPYYRAHLEQAGYEKYYDYVEIVIESLPKEISEKLQRLQPIVEKKFGVRQVNVSKTAEVKKRTGELFSLVLDTYKDLPSFVPVSDRQVHHYVEQNIPFLLPEYMPLLEDSKGNLVGYGVMIPSFAQALIRAKGRLFPFGLLHVLWSRRYHDTADLILIGVVDEWRNKGLNAIIFANMVPVFKRKGVERVFINPIIEDNQASLALFKDYGPRIFRRRRVFSKKL